ncbi:hypothetical protein AgCh_015809, partial [Apium graveolens]
GPQICELSVDSIENKVAFGTVFEDDEMNVSVHGVPLKPGHARVSVDGHIQPDGLVPVPIPGEIEHVREAIGSHLAWPQNLISLRTIVKKKRDVSQSKNKGEVHKIQQEFTYIKVSKKVPRQYKVLYKHATIFMKASGELIPIPCDSDVFGVEKTIYILYENLKALLEFDMIGQAAISAYMAHLHSTIKRVRKNDDVVLYGFFDPGANFNLNANFQRNVGSWLKEGNQNHIFFLPHNHQTIKQVNSQTGRGNKAPKIKNLVGSPKQPGGVECGYVVMRYMKEIIKDMEISFTSKWATKTRKSYTLEELDQAVQIVKSIISNDVAKDTRMAASLLSLHLHDCVVKIKSALERECPQTVSCADIMALATRDSTILVIYGVVHNTPLAKKYHLDTPMLLEYQDVTPLKMEYLFEAKSVESLADIYERFLTLLNNLSMVEKVYDHEDSNTKFLRAMNEEWETQTSIIRHPKERKSNNGKIVALKVNAKASKDRSVKAARKKNNLPQSDTDDSSSNPDDTDSETDKNVIDSDVMQLDALLVKGFKKMSKIKCYNCDEPGHFATECKKTKHDKGKNKALITSSKDWMNSTDSENEETCYTLMASFDAPVSSDSKKECLGYVDGVKDVDNENKTTRKTHVKFVSSEADEPNSTFEKGSTSASQEKLGNRKDTLVLDNGCSGHMTGNKSLLSEFERKAGPDVSYGDGNIGHTLGYGNLIIGKMLKEKKLSLKHLHVFGWYTRFLQLIFNFLCPNDEFDNDELLPVFQISEKAITNHIKRDENNNFSGHPFLPREDTTHLFSNPSIPSPKHNFNPVPKLASSSVSQKASVVPKKRLVKKSVKSKKRAQ